jgi:glycosyltransferase involved in cell wall biosynthesis
MRIAQVSPLYESVPPKLYGGTERIVSYLTEELVGLGHEVTLFASGDSITEARLVAATEQALRESGMRVQDPIAHHVRLVEMVFEEAAAFDILHFHLDYLHLPLAKRHEGISLTTLHGRLDIPDLVPMFRCFSDHPVVSISDAQRAPLEWLNWCATVHHGIPENLYSFYEKPGSYLAFLGRVSPEKRLDRAIEIAKTAEVPLKIAAKVDKTDEQYFTEQIEPLLDHPMVEFVGEIGESEKNDFLGNALALLFPIDWPEPFGLVMIESLASGTPVIAFLDGSVPEIIEQHKTGFIVESVPEAITAVRQISSLNRRACRESFVRRFGAGRMARDYVALYERLLSDGERDDGGKLRLVRPAA